MEAAYKSDIIKSNNPEQFKKEIERKIKIASSPFKSAEKFLIEDIIDPRETRPKICKWIKLAFPTLKSGPSYIGYRP